MQALLVRFGASLCLRERKQKPHLGADAGRQDEDGHEGYAVQSLNDDRVAQRKQLVRQMQRAIDACMRTKPRMIFLQSWLLYRPEQMCCQSAAGCFNGRNSTAAG